VKAASMTVSPLAICAATLILLPTVAAADPAYVTSPANLRAGAGTIEQIIAKLPAGAAVQASNCREWCEVEWQGKKGFAIATALDRNGRVPALRKTAKRDPYATDAELKGEVPMSTGPYQAPDRYYGPYYWGAGPANGPYKGTAGIGFRGRW
jgi:uncharacterized protein YraI